MGTTQARNIATAAGAVIAALALVFGLGVPATASGFSRTPEGPPCTTKWLIKHCETREAYYELAGDTSRAIGTRNEDVAANHLHRLATVMLGGAAFKYPASASALAQVRETINVQSDAGDWDALMCVRFELLEGYVSQTGGSGKDAEQLDDALALASHLLTGTPGSTVYKDLFKRAGDLARAMRTTAAGYTAALNAAACE